MLGRALWEGALRTTAPRQAIGLRNVVRTPAHAPPRRLFLPDQGIELFQVGGFRTQVEYFLEEFLAAHLFDGLDGSRRLLRHAASSFAGGRQRVQTLK